MKIVYAGGGTMGSVSPLLAVHEHFEPSEYDYEAFWIGTKNGPEKDVVEKENIKYKSISSGKLRRYFSFKNVVDVFKIISALGESLRWLKKNKPDVIVSAGGFVAVPLVWAGHILGIPSLIHQQDIRMGLANRMCVKMAKKITLAVESSGKNYFKQKNNYKQKAEITGNPIRKKILDANQLSKDELIKKYRLKKNLPIVLVMGGGTGASAINELIKKSLDILTKNYQMMHICGRNKAVETESENYTQIEFSDSVEELIYLADVVLSRAGFSVLTELAYMKKPSIIIPMPGTHQEDNAEYFNQKKAIVYLKQEQIDSNALVYTIKKILDNKNLKERLVNNFYNCFSSYTAKNIASEIIKIIK